MKHLLTCAALSASILLPTVHARGASTYPDGPIEVVVGFVAGGPTDLYGRLAARAISDAFGQQVVVENRTGGSGAIATKAPAGTPPVIINKLATALQKGLQDEKIRKSIIDSGSEPGALGPKEYATYIAEESKRWARFLEQHPEISVE